MRTGRWLVVAGGDALALWLLRPDVPRVLDIVGDPQAATVAAGIDGVLVPIAGALLWLLAARVAVGLLAAAAIGLPGAAGRIAATGARLLLPRAVRVLLVGGAGMGVALAPVGALAAPSTPTVPAPVVPTPAWPIDAAHRSTPARAPAPAPAPAWPTTADTGHRPTSVSVRRGDSLWTLAARSLGPRATPARVATEWPRWFAANRRTIGDDPGLLHPGQVLRAPAPTSQEDER